MPTPRRRGRPPLDPNDRTTTDVHVRLPSKQYDAAYAAAAARDCSVPELIRRALKLDPNLGTTK